MQASNIPSGPTDGSTILFDTSIGPADWRFLRAPRQKAADYPILHRTNRSANTLFVILRAADEFVVVMSVLSGWSCESNLGRGGAGCLLKPLGSGDKRLQPRMMVVVLLAVRRLMVFVISVDLCASRPCFFFWLLLFSSKRAGRRKKVGAKGVALEFEKWIR